MESDFVQEKTGHRCKVCRLSVRGHPGPYGRGKCKFERREGSSDEEYFKQQRGSAHVEEKLRSLRRDSKVSDLVRAVWSDSISVDTDETQVRQSRSLNLKKSSGYSRENASTRARSESPAVQFSRHRARNVSPSREAGPARPEKPDIRDLRQSRALVREVDKALDDLLDPDTSRGKQPRSKRYEDRGSVSSLSQSDSTESDFMRKLRRRQRRRGVMDTYNGVSMMVPDICSYPDELVMTDAGGTGCGRFRDSGQFFTVCSQTTCWRSSDQRYARLRC
uniref:Uncharacterized protein n=1 Tax=Branchiostoma floridae TaxID=7739 RepID=C3ZUK3_BRAFL|eukprot:XP_002587704.1 hypothetical protein BRAFLDRAFT_94607 [Branchiostoma floridae]